MFTRLGSWWQEFLSSNNARVNTGAVFATIAMVNALVILNWNFFVIGKPLDMGTVSLLTTLVGLGGWSYRESIKGLPPGWKPPPTVKPKGE
jgi:hypothetical protein